MKLLSLSAILAAAWLPSTTKADHPPPPLPAGGLVTQSHRDCVHPTTLAVGYCIMQRDLIGRVYQVFLINGIVREILLVIEDGHTVLWTADHAATSGEML